MSLPQVHVNNMNASSNDDESSSDEDVGLTFIEAASRMDLADVNTSNASQILQNLCCEHMVKIDIDHVQLICSIEMMREILQQSGGALGHLQQVRMSCKRSQKMFVGHVDTKEFGKKKYITTFLFKLKSKPAALYQSLAGFAVHQVNLTKLQSYPEKNTFDSYFFLCDLDGHIEDKKVQKSLEELGLHCQDFHVLGVFEADKLREK